MTNFYWNKPCTSLSVLNCGELTLIKLRLYGYMYNVGLWCITPLSIAFQLYGGGGKLSTRRKPPTCRKSLTNFITLCCIEYTSPWTWFKLATLVALIKGCFHFFLRLPRLQQNLLHQQLKQRHFKNLYNLLH
jgi:hypothetical protein